MRNDAVRKVLVYKPVTEKLNKNNRETKIDMATKNKGDRSRKWRNIAKN